jgi:hypothetical protein
MQGNGSTMARKMVDISQNKEVLTERLNVFV